ncbi:bifunctional DNA-formamidopyrimidine glycosylase/DNA-(apurinic or apyrimidinic site) lyase [Aquamicrobium segne]|uniref:Formamidopyrimidine-DNA glycosylase n=1 Tax=Aquamicrobium segne TaxID=469547 RepID=A0ABW0GTY8_9HYPH
MPELPEVETVRRGLQPVLEGARILKAEARRPNLRFFFPENFSEQLNGRLITAIGRRAKYLILHIEDGPALLCHLGMSGSFRIEEQTAPGHFHSDHSQNEAHDHAVFEVMSRSQIPHRIIYNDPRRFGFMLFCQTIPDEHPMLKNLGVEPTGNALSADLLATLFHNRKAPLKAALLDQRLIAGLGNIYVCEALWRAGLSPLRAAGTIATSGRKPAQQRERLAQSIRAVIADAIAAGGSSLRDYKHTDGSLGYFQHSFAVYDREKKPCLAPGCHGIIERIVQSGRSTFYCRACQK